MIRSLWIARTGLDAQQTQLDVISNNLANVSTNGFKRGRAVFEDLLYQTLRQPGAQSSQQTQIPSGLQLGTGVRPVSTARIFTQGNIQKTDNSLDVAVQGNGFFQVLLGQAAQGLGQAHQFLGGEGIDPGFVRDDAQLDLGGGVVEIEGDEPLACAGFQAFEHVLVARVEADHQHEARGRTNLFAGALNGQHAAVVGQRVQHHRGVLARFDHLVQVADGALAHGAG